MAEQWYESADWRGMDTAPHDARVLLRVESAGTESEFGDAFRTVGFRRVVAQWCDYEGGVGWCDGAGAPVLRRGVRVTGWQPLQGEGT